MKRIEKIHRYRGWDTAGGQCGLEIFDPPGGIPVMVLTQLPWNTNTSVCKVIEMLAAEVALEYLRDRERLKPAFRCIQHWYSWLGGDELFELVTFPLPWPRMKKNWDRPYLGEPTWRKIDRQELEALVGEPYVESFRRVRQIPSTTETTIEAVHLLRTSFGQLARCHGPLAAALGREDLPVVDPPESAGELYVTGLGEWLFFPKGVLGVKLLSDETVASRWDVRELTRQLLVSVRQITEIFLTYLELRHHDADFAPALVEYFAHPEKLTVEIIESQHESRKLWSDALRQETTPWELEEHRLRFGPWEEQHAQEA